MSSRWLTAFLEAGGDAAVVTLPPPAKTAKIAKNPLSGSSTPHFGNNGNFGKASETQKITEGKTESAHWTVDDWQAFYDERAAIGEHDGGLDRDAADLMAFEACVAHWQNKNPPAHVDAACPECNQPVGTNALAVLTGDGRPLWLHERCHAPWLARRRKQAITALAKMGIPQT